MRTRPSRPSADLHDARPPTPERIPIPWAVIEAGTKFYEKGFEDGYKAGLKEASLRARGARMRKKGNTRQSEQARKRRRTKR